MYTLLLTSLVSFFGVMIIPDACGLHFYGNMIGGLAMNVSGPHMLRLAFHILVVVVGFLILSGAVNTAIIGSNGVLNRVSEDGVLPELVPAAAPRYGTTYRLINLVAILQMSTIVASRGKVLPAGRGVRLRGGLELRLQLPLDACAALQEPEPREYEVPLNIRIGKIGFPVGILIVLTLLVATAATNLFTKEVATISGLTFTAAFWLLFAVSERVAHRTSGRAGLEQFQLIREETINSEVVRVRPSPVLVAVRDYKSLQQLELALGETDTQDTDVVVMTARIIQGAGAAYP